MDIAVIETYDKIYTVLDEYIKNHTVGIKITAFHNIKEVLTIKHKVDLVFIEQMCLEGYEVDKKLRKRTNKIICIGEESGLKADTHIQYVNEKDLLKVTIYNIHKFIDEQKSKERIEKNHLRTLNIFFVIIVLMQFLMPYMKFTILLTVSCGSIIDFYYYKKEHKITPMKVVCYLLLMILLSIFLLQFGID